MNPAYQGQLDVFCAAYAVINAMRHINATRLLTCRAILHEALLDAARDEESFCALLEQRTDYVDWVDAMLTRLEKQGSLLTARPFPTHFPGPGAPSPAVHQLSRESLISDPADDGPGKILIVPYTIRFLGPRLQGGKRRQ